MKKHPHHHQDPHCHCYPSQGHQPEDLPNPDCDGHVREPVEPVCQEGFRIRIPRLLE